MAHSRMLEFICGSEIKYNNISLIMQDRAVHSVIYKLHRYSKSPLKYIYCSLYTNITGIIGRADAKLKENHHLFQHGLGVNLSSCAMDLNFACGPNRTSRQKVKTSAVRKKIINRWGEGRKAYAKQVWIY